MLNRLRRELDLKLLRTLQLLIAESSVSRVAELQGQSQPAVSATLKRLRRMIGDPLLVRAAGGRLTPTDRAREIAVVVGRILADMDRLFESAETFDPRSVRRQARIVASNCLGVLMLPLIVERVRAQAPNVDLDLCVRPGEDEAVLRRRLDAGDIDMVIGNWPSPAESLRFAPLFETDIVCLMRPAHPLARARSLPFDLYLAQDHLSPTPRSGALFSPIDGRLAQLGVSRRIAVSIPEYALAPYILSRDDLIFTTGRPFADHFASQTPLSVVPSPPELGRMSFYMLWHERAHHSPFERWLRSQIRDVAAELAAIGAVEPGARHNGSLMPLISSGWMAQARDAASSSG